VVREHLDSWMAGDVRWEGDYGQVCQVIVPGDPELAISSTHRRPWMLPWTVRLGDETWQVFSPEVSQALYRLLANGKVNCPLDGRGYWQAGYMQDPEFPGERYRSLIDAALCRRFLRGLPGWDLAEQVLRLSQSGRFPQGLANRNGPLPETELLYNKWLMKISDPQDHTVRSSS